MNLLDKDGTTSPKFRRQHGVGVDAVPIRAFLAGKSFDPETIDILNAAFLGACADLGVTDKTPHARETVAKKVIELAAESNNPRAIRAAVVAFLKARH
jgi:hypothetical protein